MQKPRARSVTKIGAVSTDWSLTVGDARGFPAMGGAGWARLGQVKQYSKNHWVTGTIWANAQQIGVRSWDNHNHLDCPVVVMQRYMDVGMAGIVQRAQGTGQIVINDVDDWFWGIHENNAAYGAVDPLLNMGSNTSHYRETLLASNVVTVSTQFLACEIAKFGDVRVEVIPNGVDARRYEQRRHRKATPIIGWAGSTGHRSGDLTVLQKPFAEIRDEFHFHHTGANDRYPTFAEEVGLAEKQVTTLPMLPPHEYPYGMVFDIGVVPLVDIPFNHAKSNIKGLEYAAAGVPFVASPLPEYVELSEQHHIGRLAKTSRDWVRELRALGDYETRLEEAVRQREAVLALSAKQQARLWDELIWSLA